MLSISATDEGRITHPEGIIGLLGCDFGKIINSRKKSMNFDTVLDILRDPIWQSIGVLVAILIAIFSASNSYWRKFSIYSFLEALWILAIPILASLAIASAIWNQVKLTVILNLLLIGIFLWQRHKVKDIENSNAGNHQFTNLSQISDEKPKYTKTKR